MIHRVDLVAWFVSPLHLLLPMQMRTRHVLGL